jgi:hypothetical protein
MKNKIKSFMNAAAVMAMAFPAMARAQFQEPGNTNLPTGTLFGIVENIMNWLLGIVGILGVIGFAIAGVLYLTAAGDDDRIATAKKAMLYAIVGVIVALIGLVAIRAIRGILGAQSKF